MSKLDYLQQFLYAPLDLSHVLTLPGEWGSNRNPFVKIGDKVRLHSRQGTFKVLNLTDTCFTVSHITRKWFVKRIVEFTCAWEDFGGWSREHT